MEKKIQQAIKTRQLIKLIIGDFSFDIIPVKDTVKIIGYETKKYKGINNV